MNVDHIVDNTNDRGPGWKFLMAGLFIFTTAANCSIAASQIGLGISLLALIYLIYVGNEKKHSTVVDAPFAFFFFAGVISLFNAEQKLYGFEALRQFLIILVFYIGLWPQISGKLQKKLLGNFLTFAAIVAAASIIKFYFFDLPAGIERAQGFFSMPITFGETMSISSLICLTWLCAKLNSRRTRAALILCLTFTVTALVLSSARGACLGFFAGVGSLVFVLPRKAWLASLLTIIYMLLAIHFLGDPSRGIASFSPNQNLAAFDRGIESTFEEAGLGSNVQRIRIWQMGYKILAENHAFGVGIRHVKQWYHRFASDFERENDIIWGHHHNNLMQQMAQMGIIGLIAFVWFMLSLAIYIYRATRRRAECFNSTMAKAAIAIFVFFTVAGMTEHIWGDEEVAMLFLFSIALLLNPYAASCDSTADSSG